MKLGIAENVKKCTKKRDARAKLLFRQSKPIAFLPFSLTSPSSLLKLPIDNPEGGTVCDLIAGGKRCPHSRGTQQEYCSKRLEHSIVISIF